MFSLYIDDSGSAPEHKMAVACGIIVPALQIARLDAEWNRFVAKEEIQDFHASECLARNPRSAFAAWDDDHVGRVFARVRQITFKYSVKGFCIAIKKSDYEELVTPEMKQAVGHSYFTWAVSSVLGLAHDWAMVRSVPMEYVFDNAEKKVKREIDDAMAFVDIAFPGHFLGHSSFPQPEGGASTSTGRSIRVDLLPAGLQVQIQPGTSSDCSREWERLRGCEERRVARSAVA